MHTVHYNSRTSLPNSKLTPEAMSAITTLCRELNQLCFCRQAANHSITQYHDLTCWKKSRDKVFWWPRPIWQMAPSSPQHGGGDKRHLVRQQHTPFPTIGRKCTLNIRKGPFVPPSCLILVVVLGGCLLLPTLCPSPDWKGIVSR